MASAEARFECLRDMVRYRHTWLSEDGRRMFAARVWAEEIELLRLKAQDEGLYM